MSRFGYVAGSLQGIHSVFPLVRPEGFFTRANVRFLANKIGTMMEEEFGGFLRISPSDILRVMQRVAEVRIESIPRMNERVVMEITADYRQHLLQLNRQLKWEENVINGSLLFDAVSGRSAMDAGKLKMRDRLLRPKVGGTLNFAFT